MLLVIVRTMTDRRAVTDVAVRSRDELELLRFDAPRSAGGVSGRAAVARLLAGAFVVLALASCGGGDDTDVARPAGVVVDDTDAIAPGLVTPAEAAEIAAGDVTVIDVRTPEEFAEGHVNGATLIDFYADDFAEQIAALPVDEPYLVYCRSGNRSGRAAALMEDLGFGEVYDLDGGVIAYAAEGLPLVP
jgi:rhodanese-related sulfurtransferase